MNSHRFIEEENARLKERIRVLEEALECAQLTCDAVARRNIKVVDNLYVSESCEATSKTIKEALSSVEK